MLCGVSLPKEVNGTLYPGVKEANDVQYSGVQHRGVYWHRLVVLLNIKLI